ncbi:Predicted amidohydrolase [Candidatus Pantoea symbiotica]|jgi:predicted amidohydrolase|uniref:Predicted amidohydrolase n=1 Tax=Candidatus Pantoea symbiotica TaxID=1884370 RepID=A0A1I3ZYQ8_9GAMM|nr:MULTISPECIES: nitrilase-related carbon-nitrogen hydrolase [Pantoea]KAJ9430189.1 nitrilase-related carbon-nitrogen hydrolase [Pantoea sp. YR343]SFK49264.1 Predicted amidohydrolase [Pantoea symbiotica]SFU91220.1 Predicted amidohydrolase [Pantoea sp. YR525]
MSIQVATIQFEPTLFRKEENVARLLTLATEAARDGARLIVMPEMATTGYCWQDRAEVAPFVETADGPTSQAFAALAREFNCYLVFGMPERDAVTDIYYNSALLVGPQGLIGVHRKTHPYISEPKWAANGDAGHQVFKTEIGNIALLICMDIHFIETARLAAVGGAQIICHISNWLAERTPAPYWLTRGWENGCALIESNRWGWERGVQFSGGSCITDSQGQLLASCDSGDQVLSAELTLPLENPALKKRRPELYQRLMTNTFMWNPQELFGLYGADPLPPAKDSNIAVAQFRPENDVNANLQQIRDWAEQAKARGVELLVLPERALTGYAGKMNALTLDDAPIQAVIRLAMELDIALLVGFAERDGSHCYNSCLLASSAGMNAHYRQIHLSEADQQWASAGDKWVTCDLPCGRVGLLLGEDLLVPEAARILALEGCDIIACPSALDKPAPLAHQGTAIPHVWPIPRGADPYHWLLPRVRAGENNVWLAFANWPEAEGESFGISGVFGPDTFAFPRQESKVLSSNGLVQLAITTGSPDTTYPNHVVRRKDLVLMRQPHFYVPLVARSN